MQVQNAMQSFKTSLETTETTTNKNAENIKSAAEKSFTIVDERKSECLKKKNQLFLLFANGNIAGRKTCVHTLPKYYILNRSFHLSTIAIILSANII